LIYIVGRQFVAGVGYAMPIMDALRYLITYPSTRIATCTNFPVNDLGSPAMSAQ
jgi:hypothetical protein